MMPALSTRVGSFSWASAEFNSTEEVKTRAKQSREIVNIGMLQAE
jgi:hypothetical protein